eukprot:9744979-Lingulodinium_polyedra.AAC.1
MASRYLSKAEALPSHVGTESFSIARCETQGKGRGTLRAPLPCRDRKGGLLHDSRCTSNFNFKNSNTTIAGMPVHQLHRKYDQTRAHMVPYPRLRATSRSSA